MFLAIPADRRAGDPKPGDDHVHDREDPRPDTRTDHPCRSSGYGRIVGKRPLVKWLYPEWLGKRPLGKWLYPEWLVLEWLDREWLDLEWPPRRCPCGSRDRDRASLRRRGALTNALWGATGSQALGNVFARR